MNIELIKEELDNIKLSSAKEVKEWISKNSVRDGDTTYLQAMFVNLDIYEYGGFLYAFRIHDLRFKKDYVEYLEEEIFNLEVYDK